MLKVENAPPINRSRLIQWTEKAIGLPHTQIQVRWRGNNLHILCEGVQCPDRKIVVTRLVKALEVTNLMLLLPADHAVIYQIFIYGRRLGQENPDWSLGIDLNQLHLVAENLKVAGPDSKIFLSMSSPELSPAKPDQSALSRFVAQELSRLETDVVVDHSQVNPPDLPQIDQRKLAQAGIPSAIALYLSEVLSELGVAVKVRTEVKGLENHQSKTILNRLWVFCSSAYSPDPLLVAEPIAQRLRDLKLEGFYDAAILYQVTGETVPDWILRVDLTPPDQMLNNWASWGDGQAIARLLNQKLAAEQVEVRAVMKESTLHLCCSALPSLPRTPDQQKIVAIITPILMAIAPQGMQAATIYGISGKTNATHKKLNFSIPNSAFPEEVPAWIEWLNLPAADQPEKAMSTRQLAKTGHQEALTFLLDRLLNPNIDHKLNTGGIRILILRKENLWHIMSEAPVCPVRRSSYSSDYEISSEFRNSRNCWCADLWSSCWSQTTALEIWF